MDVDTSKSNASMRNVQCECACANSNTSRIIISVDERRLFSLFAERFRHFFSLAFESSSWICMDKMQLMKIHELFPFSNIG